MRKLPIICCPFFYPFLFMHKSLSPLQGFPRYSTDCSFCLRGGPHNAFFEVGALPGNSFAQESQHSDHPFLNHMFSTHVIPGYRAKQFCPPPLRASEISIFILPLVYPYLLPYCCTSLCTYIAWCQQYAHHHLCLASLQLMQRFATWEFVFQHCTYTQYIIFLLLLLKKKITMSLVT